MTRRGFLALLAPFTAILSGCASLLSPRLRQREVEKSWRRFYGYRACKACLVKMVWRPDTLDYKCPLCLKTESLQEIYVRAARGARPA